MTIEINKELCVGCGHCQAVCPEEAIRAWGVAKVDEELCTECYVCLGYCPVIGALEVENNA